MEQNRQDLEEVMVLEEEVKGLKNKVEVWILDICKDIRKDQNRVWWVQRILEKFDQNRTRNQNSNRSLDIDIR